LSLLSTKHLARIKKLVKVDHQKCEDYITRGRATNNWTPIQLSASANTVDIVKVTRYKKEHRLAEDDPSGLIKSI